MIVTKQSLSHMISTASEERQAQIVGRALVAIFKRQTESEREVNTTSCHNNRGFTPADAKSGSITAKYFIKHGTLLDWQVQRWIKANAKGDARIVKYWRQLDQVAKEKAA